MVEREVSEINTELTERARHLAYWIDNFRLTEAGKQMTAKEHEILDKAVELLYEINKRGIHNTS